MRTWKLVDDTGRVVMTATTSVDMTLVTADERDRGLKAQSILSDLDRCVHGRHATDSCNECGGRSGNNPFLHPGKRIGTTISGKPIVLPKQGLWDPDNFLP